MEITIKEKTYPLKASFAFLKKIESSYHREASGEQIDFGLANAIIQVRETGDLRYLVELLLAMNTGRNPRLDRNLVENYLEEECEDIEGLINEVLDFLSRANVCRLRLKKLGLLPEEKAETPNIEA